MINKAVKISALTIIVLFVLLLIIFFPFGGRYLGKEETDKYTSLIDFQSQYIPAIKGNLEPQYILPDKYPFFGRVTGRTIDSEWIISHDRMVYRHYFQFQNQIYYFYYSTAPYNYSITYPNAYEIETNEILFSLCENPQGYFMANDYYLYYVYGRDYYQKRVFSFGFITGHGFFTIRNFKDYHYARLDMRTYENEKISKEEYEEKYFELFESIFHTGN